MTATSAKDMQQSFADGTASVTDTVDHAIACCEQDPHNAILSINPKAKVAAAASARRYEQGTQLGLWDGLPFIVKDNIAAAGLPWTAGIDAYRQRIASSDAELVQWLTQQGAILIAKSHLHEAALGTSSDNPWFGQCHHPMLHGYSPGGSSGGSAVAVAANYVPLSLGTDTMGSVRIPAAFCGIYGYKPSNGLVSGKGVTRLSGLLDTIGLLAANASDLACYGCALIDDKPQPTTTSASTTTAPIVGVLASNATTDCTNDVIISYHKAVDQLQQAGVQTIEVDGFGNTGGNRRDGLTLVVDEAYHEHATALVNNPNGFSDELTRFLHYGRDMDRSKLSTASRRIEQLKTRTKVQWNNIDLVLTPATPCGTHAFSDTAPNNLADYTAIANLIGAPSVSIPYGQCINGLPLGLQLIGKAGKDTDLLAWSCHINNQLHT